jgi:hypothetical protein
MAFPGTYNIAYYKGDTLEFKIYPKDSAGNQFTLSGYSAPNFTIAVRRGDAVAGDQAKVSAYAEIVNNTYILCAIRPQDGASLVAGTTYVYDVQISKSVDPYDYTYTLLTGSISVTDQVTQPVI